MGEMVDITWVSEQVSRWANIEGGMVREVK